MYTYEYTFPEQFFMLYSFLVLFAHFVVKRLRNSGFIIFFNKIGTPASQMYSVLGFGLRFITITVEYIPVSAILADIPPMFFLSYIIFSRTIYYYDQQICGFIFSLLIFFRSLSNFFWFPSCNFIP